MCKKLSKSKMLTCVSKNVITQGFKQLLRINLLNFIQLHKFENKTEYGVKDVRSLRVNIDRALIFGHDLHEHFLQLILKFGQYLQHSLFIT